MVEILGTKLFVPHPRAGLVSRPRLTERLTAGLDKKLTLIAAPPGFGKTSLLSEWIWQRGDGVAWLSLDAGDNDPNLFWVYFIHSLRRYYAELGEDTLGLLQSQRVPPVASILTTLINQVMGRDEIFIVVLDDFHTILSQSIHEALAFLIDHMPENMHLVISTRVDPPLPLARLRAQNQLAELRSNDLRFTQDEASFFLEQATGLALSAGDVAALETRTEGWAAGLQIAALSMRGCQDVSGFIQAFSGSHRHIIGYLVEEVLNRLPVETIDFLLQTSILDRLCSELCDCVTSSPGSQALLSSLETANLFIIPLDEEGQWYRYHHIFSEVLRARLRQTHPDLLPELHQRAHGWFASRSMVEEAVHHALAGGDYGAAAGLIEDESGEMLQRGSTVSLIRWLDSLPDNLVRSRPCLCLARAWTFLWGPTLVLERAREWAGSAMQAALAAGPVDKGLFGEITAVDAMIAAIRSDVARSRELSQQALENLPLDSQWRSVMALCLGTAHFDAGEMALASQVLGEALRLSEVGGEQYVRLSAGSFLADLQVLQSHLGRAKEMYQQVLAWADRGIPQKGSLMAHAGLASILYEQNQLEAALAHIQSGVEQLDQVGGAYASLVLNRVFARMLQAGGSWAEALAVLNQVHQLGQQAQVTLVETNSAAHRACLQLAWGDLTSAQEWAVNSGLTPDDPGISHPGWREVEYLSLARVLNAQNRHSEALSLLERLLRSSEAEGRDGSAIEILVLLAMFHHARGGLDPARHFLERALVLAEPEGYIRIFVDEGDAMRSLLVDLKSSLKFRYNAGHDNACLRLLSYIDRLLNVFSHPGSIEALRDERIREPLSEREIDILRLIATGRSNQEIAEILMVAISTVKSHINSLYSKLGIQRRAQAILIARELGLLPE